MIFGHFPVRNKIVGSADKFHNAASDNIGFRVIHKIFCFRKTAFGQRVIVTVHYGNVITGAERCSFFICYAQPAVFRKRAYFKKLRMALAVAVYNIIKLCGKRTVFYYYKFSGRQSLSQHTVNCDFQFIAVDLAVNRHHHRISEIITH